MADGLKLYELAEAYRLLAEQEEPEAFAAALSQLEGSIEDKAANIAALVRTLEAEAGAYESEWKRLKAHQDSRLRRVEGLKDYLKAALATAGLTSVQAGLFKVAVQNNPPAVMLDPTINLADLPNALTRFVPARYELDSRAVLAQYQAIGKLPPGVTVTQGTHLRIR